MIKAVGKGQYKLIETTNNIKILYLDDRVYACPGLSHYSEIFESFHRKHKTDSILGTGQYYLYRVTNEPDLSDALHLELEAGEGVWQGYLLIQGLPNNKNVRTCIVATHETITPTTNDAPILTL